MTDLAIHMTKYLREHLPRDLRASGHTVDSYTFAYEQLIRFAAERHGTEPCQMKIEQLTVEVILDFLDSLEKERGNSIRTRNIRLAAVKSFFRYLEYRAPACLALAQQVSAIPSKRFDKKLVDYLNGEELQALLDAPDPSSFGGVRDRAMLHLTYTCGLRVSEVIAVMCGQLGPNLETVHVLGKGRRERVLPLWKETKTLVQEWLALRPRSRTDHLFLNARGGALSRHGFAHRLKLHGATASRKMSSMREKRISPHVLRHSIAMHTLQVTRDTRKVSAWLGHASITSTESYLQADPEMRLEVLAEIIPPKLRKGTFKTAPDRLLAMLNGVKAD